MWPVLLLDPPPATDPPPEPVVDPDADRLCRLDRRLCLLQINVAHQFSFHWWFDCARIGMLNVPNISDLAIANADSFNSRHAS